MSSFATVVEKEGGEKGHTRVLVQFNGVPEKDCELEEYFAKIDAIYKKNAPFVILYDVSRIGLLSWKKIQSQVDFMRKHEEETKRLLLRCAVVICSTPVRILIESIFVLKKPACPLEIYDNIDSAKEFLRKV